MVHVFACVKTSLWGTVFRLFGLSNEKGESILIIDNFFAISHTVRSVGEYGANCYCKQDRSMVSD